MIKGIQEPMKHARDVLNEIKWRNGYYLKDTVIYYRDRKLVEPNILEGQRIENWDKSFIYTDTGSVIPFHRVVKIKHKDIELFAKQ